MCSRRGRAAPKMMSVGLHCRLAGRPGRAASLMRFLDYIRKHERVWVRARLGRTSTGTPICLISPPTPSISVPVRAGNVAKDARRSANTCGKDDFGRRGRQYLRILAVDHRTGGVRAARQFAGVTAFVRGYEGRGRPRRARASPRFDQGATRESRRQRPSAEPHRESDAEQNSVGLDRLCDPKNPGVRARQQPTVRSSAFPTSSASDGTLGIPILSNSSAACRTM